MPADHPAETAPRPMYSIVVPVFNSEQIVAQTIERVVQTFTEAELAFELILVNDGSSDESWEVISQVAQQYEKCNEVDLQLAIC